VRGGGSVRRRNTLHVVGGGQLSLSQARFTGRDIIYKIIFYKLKKRIENDIFMSRNKIFCERIKSLKTVKYP
jgi:hypothetical protein